MSLTHRAAASGGMTHLFLPKTQLTYSIHILSLFHSPFAPSLTILFLCFYFFLSFSTSLSLCPSPSLPLFLSLLLIPWLPMIIPFLFSLLSWSSPVVSFHLSSLSPTCKDYIFFSTHSFSLSPLSPLYLCVYLLCFIWATHLLLELDPDSFQS